MPGWLWLARDALAAGRHGATDVRELAEDATRLALLDQEQAGVDVLTTGEMGRVRFIMGFYERLDGIRALEPRRKLGAPHWDTNASFEVTGTVSAPRGLGIVEEWRLARRLTARPLKATVPGPFTLMIRLRLGGGYAERDTLLADIVAIVNAECRALVAAGADFIQIDEPNYAFGVPPDVSEVVHCVPHARRLPCWLTEAEPRHDQRSQGASALVRGAVGGPPVRIRVLGPRAEPRRPPYRASSITPAGPSARATHPGARPSLPPRGYGCISSRARRARSRFSRSTVTASGAPRRRTRLGTATASLRPGPDRRVTRRLCRGGSPRPGEAGRWDVESTAKGLAVALRSRGCARPEQPHRRRARIQ